MSFKSWWKKYEKPAILGVGDLQAAYREGFLAGIHMSEENKIAENSTN